MPIPIVVWAGIGIAGLWGGSRLIDETGQAIDATTRLVTAGALAGGVYVSYRALQAGGVLK